ncbi:MAG TPA: Maf family protein, partial [Fibrobacteria bacterium]|nr:Maf family protein [Fibrobacteria bacterium]
MTVWATPASRLVLASNSPRRALILEMLGYSFETLSPDFEETIPASMAPEAAPEYLARGKAASLGNLGPEALVLGSDTVVILDGKVLGKPADP